MLHTELITAPSREPDKLLFVLHGVFGSGANWRSFTRSVARARPEWGFVLCDLRGHGGSRGGDPPHDLDAMASDLEDLETSFSRPVVGVIGHSLGGKVALTYATHRQDRLERVWILDSQPGPGTAEGTPMDVLTMLEELPRTFERREDFVDRVMAHGHDKAIAAWLAMHVRREDGELVVQLDLPAIRSILSDYFERDLWPELQRVDTMRKTHVVVGTRSSVWQPADIQRLEGLDVQTHRLEAGHWVHVDAPDALQALLIAHL